MSTVFSVLVVQMNVIKCMCMGEAPSELGCKEREKGNNMKLRNHGHRSIFIVYDVLT